MKHSILLIISILTFTSLVAQTTDYDYTFGDIPQKQLEMTVYDKDSTAVAVMLLNYCKVYYDIYNEPIRGVFYKYHYRFKVLDKEKFKRKDIKLYSNYYNDIQEVTAQTINYTNGKAVYKKVAEVFEKSNGDDESKIFSFSFPDVQNGSVLEYQFTTFRLNYRIIAPFYFQKEYPVVTGQYHFAIPDGRSYAFLFNGKEKAVEEKTRDFRALNLSDKCVEYYWVYKDVPAMKEEVYVTTMGNYRTNVNIQLNSDNKARIVNQGNGVSIDDYNFLSNWDELGEAYLCNLNTIIENYKLIKPMFLDVIDDVRKCETKQDSIQTVFEFVASKVRWNGYYTDFSYENLRAVYKKGSGTSGEINYILLGLFKQLKIEAFPVLLSTRNNGKLNQSYPYANQFNHVIAAIKQDNNWLLLDATDNLMCNLLPKFSLNYDGLIIENKKASFINIPFPTNEEATFINGELTADGVLNATMNIMKTNYAAYAIRKKIAEKGLENYQENYFSGSSETATVSDIKHKNLEHFDKRLSESVTFSATDVGQISGDFIYWDLFMGLGLDENPFQLETRNYPVELPYKMKETFIFQIKMPEGYALESLPQPRKYSLPNKEGFYLFSVEESNGILKINSTLKINRADFKIHQYQAIKDLFENVIEAQTTQIVLKKK